MPRPKAKWKVAIDEKVKAMDNDTLYAETLSAAAPDDYDGYFTSEGEYAYDALRDELRLRLFSAGFLTKLEG